MEPGPGSLFDEAAAALERGELAAAAAGLEARAWRLCAELGAAPQPAFAAANRGPAGRALSVLAAAALPVAGAEGQQLAAAPPEGAASLLRLLAGLTALFVERVDAGRRSAQARRLKARSVCAALPYADSRWPWSNEELQAPADALLRAVGGALLRADADAAPTPAADAAANDADADAQRAAAVFTLLPDVAECLGGLPASVASRVACWIAAVSTVRPMRAGLCPHAPDVVLAVAGGHGGRGAVAAANDGAHSRVVDRSHEGGGAHRSPPSR